MEVLELLLFGVFLASLLGAAILFIRNRRKVEEAGLAAAEEAAEKGREAPLTLHPVVDPDKCMGSLSCLSVCPEGDILGVVDGKAALINPSACIGHGKCALECPVGAIKLVFGTATRGAELPELDEYFESSREGVHVVGELGGMGLIKNAITQGLQVAEHLGARLKKPAKSQGLVDVAVVGAGPAGLATALGLQKAGFTYRVLEQDSIGGTIAHYPRQKIVMTEKVELPFLGKFGRKEISKEELLAQWQKAIARSGMKVETGVKVTGLQGQDGRFVVETSAGPVAARKVVLAVGRRGTPRKLGVPGEDLPKVAYRLIDPQQYEGCKVLVVGGGDAALEAAIQLAEETSAEVILSYRQAELGRCREANKRKFGELVAKKAIRALMPSTVKAITPRDVTLEAAGRQGKVPNDFVLVCIGGELPTEFLGKTGVGMHRLFGTAPGAHGDEEEADAARAARGSAKQAAEERRTRRLSFGLFVVGALTVALLAAVGGDYYALDKAGRLEHPAHAFLRPSGPWGHGVGIVATLAMMLNFLYAVRKRWSVLKGAGPIRGWLTFHQANGFMSPLFIAFHSAFQSNNVLATFTAGSLLVVVGTGMIGRFVFGLVPSSEGKQLRYDEVVSRWDRMKSRVNAMGRGVTDPHQVKLFLERMTRRPEKGNVFYLLLARPFRNARDRTDLMRLRGLFPNKASYRDFVGAWRTLERLRTQVGVFHAVKRFVSVWRVFHVVLAVGLVVVIAAHIGVSLFLGYRWILR